MKYKLTLWLSYMKVFLKQGWKAYLILSVIGCLIYVSQGLNGQELNAFTVMMIAVGNALLFFVIFSLIGMTQVAQTHSYLRIYEEKGYCREMCEAFEEKHIRGKEPGHFHRLFYAEIHLRLGDTERALFLLDQLRIPERETYNRALFIILYIQTALFRNDTALAHSVWYANRFFLDKFFYDNRYKAFVSNLRACQAAIEAADGSYAQALDLIGQYMPAKKNRPESMDFLALQVYIYHMMNSAENEARAVAYMKKAIAETKFETERVRINACKALEDAQNGKLPL